MESDEQFLCTVTALIGYCVAMVVDVIVVDVTANCYNLLACLLLFLR